ncbi:hypothetical protein D1872_211430 [compost metagenome]
MPSSAAAKVPTIRPIRTEMERRKPLANRFINTTNNRTPKPSARLAGLPKPGLDTSPPPKSVRATGIRVTPIMVTTEPVTTGGNKAISFPNKPENKKTNSPEAMIAP